MFELFIHRFYPTSRTCIKNYHFWHKNDGEKWSRKNSLEIPPCAMPFSDLLITNSKPLLLHGRYEGHFKDALVHSPGAFPSEWKGPTETERWYPLFPKKEQLYILGRQK